MQGLSRLLASIMVAGEVVALDARDPRLAHRALIDLGYAGTDASKSLLSRFGVSVHGKPDPDVGLRVQGLTRASWEAVADGTFNVYAEGNSAWFELSDVGLWHLSALLDRLPVAESRCLYGVGAEWAFSSSARKNFATDDSVGSRSVPKLA